MHSFFSGNAEKISDDLKKAGVKYAVELGRRAPMHRVHVECLKEIIEAGLTPVVIIGSANGADSALFDPVRNPLTEEQQKEQIRQVLGDAYDEKYIIALDDTGDAELWYENLFSALQSRGVDGDAVIHYRSKVADAKNADAQIKPLSHYMTGFAERGLTPWESFNTDPADDFVNASDIRLLDLEKLTPAQAALMSAPDYICTLARRARSENPDAALLSGLPLTVFDLTLDRLRREAGITTADVVHAAGELSVAALSTAAYKLVKALPPTAGFAVKIASASTNQTGGDWPRNIANICRAIDTAVADGADVLALEELGLTGYERGDDFYYSDNAKTREMLQLVADYAASKNPNLVISIGHPWFFADKDVPSGLERRKSPIYNRINNNFNVQTLLSGGEIVAMSAKRYLFNYERGYEKRHFEEWSDTLADSYQNKFGRGREGTILIELPGMTYEDGTKVPAKPIPFGSPVVQIGRGLKKANLTHVICEEYWVGSRFDGGVDNRDYARDNPLAQKAQQYDITIALNPNASPPVVNKIDKHYELSKLASKYCGVLVHTDGLGSSGSTFAQFGSRLMAQDGEIVSEGKRISFDDVAYTSQIVTLKTPVDKGHRPHAFVGHDFAGQHAAPLQDGAAPWEKGSRRAFEEEMRNEILWLFDYMRKNKIQGVTQALSGGKDSTYNAAKVRLMVELAVSELGVKGFMDSMSHLKYKNEVLSAYAVGGTDKAVAVIMDNMLTCVYMGTSNSSQETLNAARTLVEGGVDADGKTFAGIGGKFHYRNVDRLVEVYAEIFSGVNPGQMSVERETEVRQEIAKILRTRKDDTTPEELERKIHALKCTFDEITHDIVSTAKDEHMIAYENIQARLRQVLIMMFSNVENKIAIANPNLDEARNSYATWGGDLHSGQISGNAHKDKTVQTEHMHLLYEYGLDGTAPVKGFYWALKNTPSAELQPLDKDGKVTQFDEDQLGRSFSQMKAIALYMLYQRASGHDERKNSPTEVYTILQDHPGFAGDDIETLHDRVRLSYDKWAHSQFKIHGSPVAATLGENVDHQSSMRTPNIAAFHKPELAQLAVHVLRDIAARDGVPFMQLSGGYGFDEISKRALMDAEFANALSSKMWTPDADDGRQMKIAGLYAYVRRNGFKDLLPEGNQMAGIFNGASEWRQRKQAGVPANSAQNKPDSRLSA
jgi:NAD+ synthase (glutamine-hydrolysing)